MKKNTKQFLIGMLSLGLLIPSISFGAIAFDASVEANVTATSLTFSHTVTGSNPILFVYVFNLSSSDNITGVTYAGVSMTRVRADFTNQSNFLYALPAPATGANNVVVSANASIYIDARAISFTGAKNEQPEANAGAVNTNSASISQAITTISNNAWVVAGLRSQSGITSAGANTTERYANSWYEATANPITPAGSVTLNVNTNVNPAWSNAISLAVFAPFVEPVVSSPQMQVIWVE